MKAREIAPRWEPRLLLLTTTFLAAFGVAAVYGASSIVALQGGEPGSAFALRQAIGVAVGAVLLVVGARTDYHVWQRYAWPIWGGVFAILVIMLLPIASPIVLELNGARRWVGFRGLSIQPSEFAKFTIVAWTAMLAAKKGTGVRDLKKGLVPFLVIVVPTAAAISFQPSLSMALLVVLLAGVVLFSAGARVGHFILIGMVAVPFLWREITLVQYRLQRWLGFLSPGTDYADGGWQIQQSLIGIGAGRLFGVGFGEGTQKMGYLPYGYSDFIFSTIGEEWGFLGVVGVVAAFSLFVWLGLRIARAAEDPFGTLLAVGLTALVGVTAFLHMAVTLGVVPTTGIPLPFISFGRSNLLVSLFATGVLLNIAGGRRPRASQSR